MEDSVIDNIYKNVQDRTVSAMPDSLKIAKRKLTETLPYEYYELIDNVIKGIDVNSLEENSYYFSEGFKRGFKMCFEIFSEKE